jgi:hypothetical protein
VNREQIVHFKFSKKWEDIMKTQLNIRKNAVLQVFALMAMFIAVFANLDSLPVSADTGQIETPSTRDRGRSSPYWVGRGLIIEEPGSPDNHVMILRQKHRLSLSFSRKIHIFRRNNRFFGTLRRGQRIGYN